MNWLFFTLAAAILLVALGGLWIVVPHLLRKRGEKRLRALCREKRIIALTYDDGPGEAVTEDLLDLLKDRGVHATFFVLGHRATQAPQIVGRLAAAGHTIGSHSQNHLHAWKSLPTRSIADIDAGFETLAKTGIRTKLFRPPFGKLVLSSWIYAKRRGYNMLWWTVDSADSLEHRKDVEIVVDEVRRAGGGVILMHDYDGYKLSGHREYVLSLTDRLVEMARAEKFTIVTALELFAD